MSEEKQQQQLVAIKDLPIYAEQPKLSDFRFVEDQPLIGQRFFRRMRLACEEQCSALKARLGIVEKSLEPVKEAATATEDYFRKEGEYMLPKAAAITLGGMAGFVMGMRGRKGMLRRWIYAGVGVLVMSAFCYPNDAMHIFRTGVAHTQRTWEDFQAAPDPVPEPQKKKKE